MEIFHYLAVVLKDTPLFESIKAPQRRPTSGAIYNDVDFNIGNLLTFDMSFSQTTNVEENDSEDENCFIPAGSVEKSILEADDVEGALYQHLVFDTEYMDTTTRIARDEQYLEKVYAILTKDWPAIVSQMRPTTIEIYQMRHRNEWKGADSVYDAWLLSSKLRRRWFANCKFHALYPKWKEAHLELQERIEENPETLQVCLL